MMLTVNSATKVNDLPREMAEGFVKLLNPICPFITEELWAQLGHNDTIAYESWPTYDENKMEDSEVEIPIQVNGKLRGKISVSKTATEDEIKAEALEAVASYVAVGVKKIIYIPNRIFNIVV